MGGKSQLKLGAILSYAQMAISIVVGLVYTPTMLKLLGQSEYGLYSTVSSTISLLSILNLGFGASYVKYYSKYKSKNDYEGVYSINGLFITIFSIIGLISLSVGMYMTVHLELIFKNGLNMGEYRIAFILMMLLVLRTSIAFPFSVFTSIISAHEKFVFLKGCGIIESVVSPILSLVLLLQGVKSIGLVVVSVFLGTFIDLVHVYYCVHILNQKIIFRRMPKEIVKELFVYTGFIAINIVVDQINWNIDKILLARFKGTAMVAVYALGYHLYSFYLTFSTGISGVFTPRIHKIVAETEIDSLEQRKKLTDLFIRVGRIQFILLGLLASGLFFWGREFITKFWADESYTQSYYVMLLLVLPSSIALIQNLGIEIQRAENRHQFRSICYLVMALINLGVSIILCQLYGAVGSAIGTAISLVVANGLIMNVYYQKRCNIDIIVFWKSILSLSKGLIIPCICALVIKRMLPCNSVFSFIASTLIYTIIYGVSVWLLGMNSEEKALVTAPIKKLIRVR